MFYLTTHSTFYLRLYGVGHMVKDHSDSERRKPLPPHGLLFPISSKGSFICTIPQTGQLHEPTDRDEQQADCILTIKPLFPTQLQNSFFFAKFPSLQCAHIFLWLNPTGHSKFHNTSKHPPPATDSSQTARTPLYPPVQAASPYSLPPFLFLSRTGVRYNSLL